MPRGSVDAPQQRRLGRDRQPQSRHEIVLGAHGERAGALVVVGPHLDLVVQEVSCQRLGFRCLGQVQTAQLKERLETHDQIGLPSEMSEPPVSTWRSPWLNDTAIQYAFEFDRLKS